MLTVISPAKTLDLISPVLEGAASQPQFLDMAAKLAKAAAKLKPGKIKQLMHISDALAGLNVARFNAFGLPFTSDNARPAIRTFAGDVYIGFDAQSLDGATLAYAQNHLRILSGLYGVLRPLDLMQPYRMEMKTRFGVGKAKTLYEYWGARIAEALASDLADHPDATLINLASNEYFAAVKTARLPGAVITPTFREWRGSSLKFNSFAAKRARGSMARFICDNRIDRPEGLRDFARDGYRFEASLSDEGQLSFVRDAAGEA
jgi:cytoplasmic iron level regulating protein YaaA (DUF328/UPF0246 family)